MSQIRSSISHLFGKWYFHHATIPTFPAFKKLELSDKEAIEKITSKYPPYSDFNFVSMWSWDIKGEMRISMLHGNLVVRFTDYITGEPFYSFLGNNNINETVGELLELSKKEGLGVKLKLVPEDSIRGLDGNRFKIVEDRDNFDYIYNIPILAGLKGNAFQTQRGHINQFLKNYKNWQIKVVNFSEIYHKNNIISLFTRWVKNKGDSLLMQEYKNEFLSLNKLLLIDDLAKFHLTCFEIYIENELIGFVINECVGEHNIIHFEKADTTFRGSYSFLMQQNSKNLNDLGIKYLNFEQDLGIDSLRFTKTKLRPSSFLKKYLVTI